MPPFPGQPFDEISATEPEWSRERPRSLWDPSRRLLRSIRRYQAAAGKRSLVARIARNWWAFEHRFWSVITQAEISPSTKISGGLQMPHPNGIVIHPGTIIGPNCLIFQQVTLGTRANSVGAPQLGGHVDVGAGARILGPVTIGDHAIIGANAVVTRDVPPRTIAVGIPATHRLRNDGTE